VNPYFEGGKDGRDECECTAIWGGNECGKRLEKQESNDEY
jgi:hypothetical protein